VSEGKGRKYVSLVTGFSRCSTSPKECRQLLIIATDANSHLGSLVVYTVGTQDRSQDGVYNGQGCSETRIAKKIKRMLWWPWYEVPTIPELGAMLPLPSG